jgi:hypothetical protein
MNDPSREAWAFFGCVGLALGLACAGVSHLAAFLIAVATWCLLPATGAW